jgi:CMP-N-acetylneuraminic acid synthetase
MTLCFIPARGGSKRIPGKNSRTLGGRPLIAWTIETARESACFDRVVVSSDDETILTIAQKNGAVADRRPDELAGDRVRFVEVVDEYLRRPENAGHFTRVVVMLPTCPFRNAEDVRRALELHRANPQAFVVTISQYEFPPDFACDFDSASGQLRLRHPEVYEHSTQSQSVAPAYHPNGAIYAGSVSRFLETRSFFAAPVLATLLPPERSFDLDHPHQWELAESLASHIRKP